MTKKRKVSTPGFYEDMRGSVLNQNEVKTPTPTKFNPRKNFLDCCALSGGGAGNPFAGRTAYGIELDAPGSLSYLLGKPQGADEELVSQLVYAILGRAGVAEPVIVVPLKVLLQDPTK